MPSFPLSLLFVFAAAVVSVTFPRTVQSRRAVNFKASPAERSESAENKIKYIKDWKGPHFRSDLYTDAFSPSIEPLHQPVFLLPVQVPFPPFSIQDSSPPVVSLIIPFQDPSLGEGQIHQQSLSPTTTSSLYKETLHRQWPFSIFFSIDSASLLPHRQAAF